MALQKLRRGPLEETTRPSNNNEMSSDSSSPWPEIESGAIVFLLDARDDFEVGLLQDWVESRKPNGDSQLQHSFIRLPKGRVDNLQAALLGLDDFVWTTSSGYNRCASHGCQHRMRVATALCRTSSTGVLPSPAR
jgi:hypothetical protein